jgi:hypothetical protein
MSSSSAARVGQKAKANSGGSNSGSEFECDNPLGQVSIL